MSSRLLDDPWLSHFADEMRARAESAAAKERDLTGGGISLAEWASAHEYYGLHRVKRGWVFREWAPNATSMWLVGDFSGWKTDPAFELFRIPGTDAWERKFPVSAIREGDNYRLEMRWNGGRGERIPAYARYVVQDPETKLFCAKVFQSRYKWKYAIPPRCGMPLIYEAHAGMAGEEPKVSGWDEFRRNMLPRIKRDGYDTIQLMAVMEHPYYGSFGYHVSSFFAESSRFGTPDELKRLVDEAHGMGLRVIMDIVHSHSVKNERDGIGVFDGTDYQYFHSGARGIHPAWDSRCFDYGKTGVLHFLLSNCRFWLDEYRFDGFRFDGVTSMLYRSHGLGEAFVSAEQYFGDGVDMDAWRYLALANKTIHEVRPDAITIAEDVSGMPGCAAPLEECGLGFDYRLAMGEPDFWFRLAAETRDEDWPVGGMFHALTDRRAEEKTVSYVESHDQALVGGKTFFFQLADSSIYYGMGAGQHGVETDRAVALHKMARLATFALNGGAYLNFMGNEFGHPEWIDFPREENGWDYSHARRLWSVGDDPALRFKALGDFDREMTGRLKAFFGPDDAPVPLVRDESAKVLAFMRGRLLLAFNFNPSLSYEGFPCIVPSATRWRHLCDTDETRFAGYGRIAAGMEYPVVSEKDGAEIVQRVKLYLPSRTALVLERI